MADAHLLGALDRGQVQTNEIALTLGADGCRLFGPELDRPIQQAGFAPRPGGDTVGCGDAFTAVWIDSVLAGVPLPRAVEAACRYAAFVAGQRGATPPVPSHLVRALAAQ